MTQLWKNTPGRFGLFTKSLHWVMAVLIIGLLALGLYLANVKIPIAQLYLYGWHKAAGTAALTLAILRILWVLYSRPPKPLGETGWHRIAAKAAHGMLYLLMLVVPLSGWIASSATGFEMSFFGLFPIPFIAPVSENIEDTFFAIHHFATRGLIALLLLHMAAALHRQFVKKDGTLRRMWF